jgi:exodeoxyribonuclease VII large subunit
MENGQSPLFSVSDFLASVNQTLEYAYPSVEIEGEVSSFKVNQNKYVFFDLKDAGGTVGCFMTVWQLRMPIEDGMKVVVRANAKLTDWGKFSLTIQSIRPSGEGSLKKSFDILKAKLETEGLFSDERKRTLPSVPRHIAVISSTGAAGYHDFIKILNDRWGGLKVDVAHVQVQGEAAPDQMIRAFEYINAADVLPEVIVLIRGGGSADDLSAFNDEQLVRTIARSRVPTLVGVGHEVDTTLADLVADVRAATPSNAAQIVVPDRREIIERITNLRQRAARSVLYALDEIGRQVASTRDRQLQHIAQRFDEVHQRFVAVRHVMDAFDPSNVLRRGYAIMRGEAEKGSTIEIQRYKQIIQAEVTHVSNQD